MKKLFQIGHIPWSNGKKLPHSEETKKKISLARKGKGLGNKNAKGNTPWNKGKRTPGIGGRKKGGTSWTKGKTGEKHPCWKKYKMQSLKNQIRSTFEYRQWRSDIFKRDNYTCIYCGYSGGHILEADHIISLSEILKKYNIKNLSEALSCEELWDLNNGRTLCKYCHIKTETYAKNLKYYILNDNIRDDRKII